MGTYHIQVENGTIKVIDETEIESDILEIFELEDRLNSFYQKLWDKYENTGVMLCIEPINRKDTVPYYRIGGMINIGTPTGSMFSKKRKELMGTRYAFLFKQ